VEPNPVKRFIDYRLEDVKNSGASAGAAAVFVGVVGLANFYLYERSYPEHHFEIDASVRQKQPVRPIVKQLMALVGCKRALKEFNESTGMVEYTIAGPMYTFNLSGGAPTACEVEEIEQMVTIPAVPEKKEKVKRFRLVDPKCLGSQADGVGPTPKVRMATITGEDAAEMTADRTEVGGEGT